MRGAFGCQASLYLLSLSGTFKNCYRLRKVVIPNGTASLAHAFDGCENLNQIYLPSSLNIMSELFEDSIRLYDIYYGGSEDEWKTLQQLNDLNASSTPPRNPTLQNATIHYNASPSNMI